MRVRGTYVRGNVLPTVLAVCVVMLVGMLGLLTLWGRERLFDLRCERQRQARADTESAYTLYRLHPARAGITCQEGYLLYDSLPRSRVLVRAEPWGLYEVVRIASADSLASLCRLTGVEPRAASTLYCADNGTALTVAGRCRLQGVMHLPRNGLVYGRMGADFYDGQPVPQAALRHSEPTLPPPDAQALARVRRLLALRGSAEPLRADLSLPLAADSTLCIEVGSAEIGDCALAGRVVLTGESIRIDSTCRLRHVLVCARKVVVGAGADISAQIFARDTVVVEPRAAMRYPSGVYAQRYVEVGDRATIDGYAIVRDTVPQEPPAANYRQSPTARLRGLLYVAGTAQLQGIAAGRICLERAAYFSPEGYYKDMLFHAALLCNPHTAQPLWIEAGAARRKEVACDY